MDFVSLALFGAAVVGLGAAATVMIAKWLPQSAIEQAGQHGRFVGLGEAPRVGSVNTSVRMSVPRSGRRWVVSVKGQ
ncbi:MULTISPECIES: hypothetical protein [unclassified Paraburkholderia]|uniref:hypothetical protein n=1 Tax=unclassified Paraburkholderia TaxID=2615204 RepID=UPI002AB116D0|nr:MULTISPECIES: hypothetical protein [unclassified Paraburkholderia]